jgi:eukaryotic-like serine/threonine-protein kinase
MLPDRRTVRGPLEEAPIKDTETLESQDQGSGVSPDSVDSFLREAAAISEPGAGEALPAGRLEAGEIVGERFRIERLAGTGGMGAVYRADDLTTGGHAAIKVTGVQSASAGERFLREGVVLAELSHPCIVRYIAQGLTPRGSPFLAMDWLEGEDLCLRLARSGLEVAESLAVARRVCEGLEVAHARGVVHRDIKPSNLFLVGGDPAATKIIDFGVARVEAGAAMLTRPGTSLGTAGYMAPEQAMEAKDVDARADFFALGCVLYECLTGRPAFGGRPAAVLVKVLRDQPPRPSELRAGLDGEVDALVARLLAKDREARPGSAQEVLQQLDAIGPPSGLR